MARKLKVDFTDVESYVRCEEGEHVAVLKEITEQEAKESGNDMLVAKFEVIKGSSTGAIVYNNFVLVEKALWRLKAFLEAIGVKAEGKVMIDLDKLVGKKVIIVVNHEEYQGQARARIESFKPLSAAKSAKDEDYDEDDYENDEDDMEDEDEEEAPPKKSKKEKGKPDKKADKKSSKKRPEPEDEDEDEDDWEDDDE